MDPHLIELKLNTGGFDQFVGSWLCRGEMAVVFDVGPASSIGGLLESLEAMHVKEVDFVLLTHIHIDHAGGLAEFLEHFPMARAICHNKGIDHLVEPSRLWAGSLEVLGEVAESYGPIKPVKRERLISHKEANIEGLRIIETPGHAPSHLSFCYQGNLFAGEAGGNLFTVRGSEYLVAATPPPFSYNKYLRSIDRLLREKDQPICYAHFGRADSFHQLLKRHREQAIQWEEIIREEMSLGKPQELGRYVDILLDKDPNLRAFGKMGPQRQERERFLIANSVKGYLDFLNKI